MQTVISFCVIERWMLQEKRKEDITENTYLMPRTLFQEHLTGEEGNMLS